MLKRLVLFRGRGMLFHPLVLTTLLFGTVQVAHGDLVVQAVSATTDMTPLSNAAGDPNNVRDQSGLSTSYTSGVTDFDTYVTSGVTHFGATGNIFGSAGGSSIGNFDFDLGTQFSIQSLALWNFGNNSPSNIAGFTLFAGSDSLFSSSTNLGSFTADPNLGPVTASGVEVFNFAQVTTQFVRLRIDSNNSGGTTNTIFGEVAFNGTSAVPEPSSLAFLGLATLGLVFPRRRSR